MKQQASITSHLTGRAQRISGGSAEYFLTFPQENDWLVPAAESRGVLPQRRARGLLGRCHY